MNSQGTGSTFKAISKNILESLKIKKVNKKQQEDLVNKLNSISNIIEKRKQQLEQLDTLIKARFIEMFGDIRDVCELNHYICSLIAGKSLAGDIECDNKVLKTGAVSFNYFDAKQLKNLPVEYKPNIEHLVSKRDIVISRMNTAELTGAAAYVWNVPENVYLPDRLWKAVLNDNSNPIFIWQVLIQSSTKEQIKRECSGTSGSMKNISKSAMLGLSVKKVPIDLQNKFTEFVKQTDKSKVVVKKALDEAQILFDSLMQEYFG